MSIFAEPYCAEQEDCRAAFEDLGYKAGGLGHEYVGNYDVKGCYGYKPESLQDISFMELVEDM